MRTRLYIGTCVIACSAAAFGCAGGGSGPTDDDLYAAAPVEDGEAGVPDDVDAFTYVTLTGDPRTCAAPACGGFFAERVNRDDMTCADGTASSSCYVADLDWSATGLSADTIAALEADAFLGDQRVLLRGDVETRLLVPEGLGVLVVREAWRAVGDGQPDGLFVRIEDAGIRCIAAPCESMHEQKLNSQLSALIAEVDVAAIDASEEDVAEAMMAIDAGGLIVAGERSTVTGPAGEARARAATQIWARVTPPAGDCMVGGCGGSLCTDQLDAVTTCEWRPEYACYRDATCERQGDGACGWTMTPSLQSCLAAPP
jgi:hypothetical protein